MTDWKLNLAIDEGENEDWIKFGQPDVDNSGKTVVPKRDGAPLKPLSEGSESSGFKGHAGREGERGGSTPSGAFGSVDINRRAKNAARVAEHRARKQREREASPAYIVSTDRLYMVGGKGYAVANTRQSRAVEKTLARNPPEVVNIVHSVYLYRDKASWDAECEKSGLWDPAKGPNTINGYCERDTGRIFGPEATLLDDTIMVFDHEVGHVAYEKSSNKAAWDYAYKDPAFDRHTAYAKFSMREGFAEAYAAWIAFRNEPNPLPKAKVMFDAVAAVVQGVK